MVNVGEKSLARSESVNLIAVETQRPVLTWVQERLAGAGRLKGRPIAIDATMLEANATMRSILRQATGQSYQEFLTGLPAGSGMKTPTCEAVALLDRRWKQWTAIQRNDRLDSST